MGISEKVPLLGIEEFLTEVNDIKELIAAYDENLEEINNIQDKLMKLCWTPVDRESLTQDRQRLWTKNKESRKLIVEKIKLGWSRNVSDENYERIRSEKMTLLTEELNKAVEKTKVSEIHFDERMRQKLIESVRMTDNTLTEAEILHKLEESNQFEDFCPESILGLTKEAKHQLDEITGRYDQIRQLEDDILELTDLFKEMQELVALQGCKMTRAENKIDDARLRVGDGVESLLQAKDDLYRTIKKKKFLAIIALAVFLILLIIIIASSLPQTSQDSVVVVITPSTTAVPASAIPTQTTTTNPDECDSANPFCVG